MSLWRDTQSTGPKANCELNSSQDKLDAQHVFRSLLGMLFLRVVIIFFAVQGFVFENNHRFMTSA